MGIQEGSTKAILEHSFFSGYDQEGLYNKITPAPILPPSASSSSPKKDLTKYLNAKERKYEGDQMIFKDF